MLKMQHSSDEMCIERLYCRVCGQGCAEAAREGGARPHHEAHGVV